MSTPLVSIAVTSYNQQEKLVRAIESVLNQTYKNIQIIIADDYSTQDNSRNIIMDYKKRYGEQIRPVFQKRNVGIPKNKNSGFRACDGDYVSYLDGDDFYYPKKIEQEIKIFKEKNWADIVYSNFSINNLDGTLREVWAPNDFIPLEGDVFEETYTRKFPQRIMYRCELMKKNILSSINYYDENIAAFHDWDSRIRMTKKFKVAYNDNLGSAYVDDPSGISKTKEKIELFNEMKYIIKKNNYLLSELNKKDQKKIKDEINYLFSRKELSITNSFSVKAKHFVKYPKDIFENKLLARIRLLSSKK